MFSLAYVILPFSGAPPAEAIGASLARFRRGRRGEVPDEWLAFDDETAAVRRAHAARFTFMASDAGGLRILGDADLCRFLNISGVRAEMRRRGLRRWRVRFADAMDLDGFVDRYCAGLERHSGTGAFGRWLNGAGRWDWWDLGGRFDGAIFGDGRRRPGRGVPTASSGPGPGRAILANLEDRLAVALGQEPAPSIDPRSDRNIELVATLLADARAGRAHACPAALVLPPGAVEDRLRWLDAWPRPGPAAALARLGLPPGAAWASVVAAAYARFRDHWAAGVAFHH